MNLKRMAEETVAVLERGHYTPSHGSMVVEIAPLLRRCLDETVCFSPDDLAAIGTSIRKTSNMLN